MKHLYFLLIAAGFFNSTSAQTIIFPDTNFKNKLLSSSPQNFVAQTVPGIYIKLDANSDGEIQISEAESITLLDVDNANISDLSGISHFVNLTLLHVSGNDLTAIDLSGLDQLTNFRCLNNAITDINSINAPYLEELGFSNNQVTTFDVANFPNLKNLSAGINPLVSLSITNHDQLEEIESMFCELTSITLQNLPSLDRVYLGVNQLSSLNFSGLDNLTTLYIPENQIETFDFNALPLLVEINASDNLFTSIDVSSLHNLANLSCTNNPQLKTIFAKNGANENIDIYPGTPLLEYICADEMQIQDVQDTLGSWGIDAHVNSFCSFVPGGEYTSVTGNIKLDLDANGCDDLDLNAPMMHFLVTGNNDSGIFISNSESAYSFPLQTGTYSIAVSGENAPFYDISPSGFEVTPGNGNVMVQNICLVPNGPHPDLEVIIIPLTAAVPGFDADYKLILRNKGLTQLSGSVTFQYEENFIDFISTDGNILFQSDGNLEFSFSDLMPFEVHAINVTLNINAPTDTPPVNIDQQLNFGASITPVLDDEKPLDNMFDYNQIVVGSFDPNDKTCLEGATITPEMVGDYVHYMIRFENTGTFPAENIVVKDMIDLSKFDITTLIPLSGSHPFETRISSGNKVEFIFENINLPFDDANNDGYVAFKIKTKPTLVVGDAFANSASIYFDYNFPIVTDPATTTIAVLGNPDFDFSQYFTLYPNPAKNLLNIAVKEGVEAKSVNIYNLLGQLVLAIPNAQNVQSIDVSDLRSGNYFIKVSTDKGIATTQFVKL